MITLKPCPMCGKEAKFVRNNDHHGDYFDLGCSDKECLLHRLIMDQPSEGYEQEVCLRWNRRAEDVTKRENARLKKEIKRIRLLIRQWAFGIMVNSGPQLPDLKPIVDDERML